MCYYGYAVWRLHTHARTQSTLSIRWRLKPPASNEINPSFTTQTINNFVNCLNWNYICVTQTLRRVLNGLFIQSFMFFIRKNSGWPHSWPWLKAITQNKNYLFLWKTKEEILRNVSVVVCSYNGSQSGPKVFGHHILQNIFFLFCRRKSYVFDMTFLFLGELSLQVSKTLYVCLTVCE